ncbi:MAG: AIR synthase-related protein, partial [bacterium]
WQFQKCIEGLAAACRALETPVISGNVSFYNENPKGAVDPTPMVGMVGLIEDAAKYVTQDFKKEGDVIVLLGSPSGSLAGSEYLRLVHRLKKGNPAIDIEFEKKVQAACLEAIQAGLVKSAHDPSEGGLAVCVAESCISNKKQMRGARIDVDALARKSERLDEILFGEAPSRIVVTVESKDLARLVKIATKHSVPCFKLGTVEGDHLVVKNKGANAIDLSLQVLSDTWRGSIPAKAGMPAGD